MDYDFLDYLDGDSDRSDNELGTDSEHSDTENVDIDIVLEDVTEPEEINLDENSELDIDEDISPEDVTEPEEINLQSDEKVNIAELIAGLDFTSETEDNWRDKPARAGRGFPVLLDVMRKNGIGTHIDQLSTVSHDPIKIYNLVYGNSITMIVVATNSVIDIWNSKPANSEKQVEHVTAQEIRSYFGAKILIMLKKGQHEDIRPFYREIYGKERNMFTVLPNKTMDDLQIPVYTRYLELVKFLHQVAQKPYVEKQKFVKSTAKKWKKDGGFFQTIYRRNNAEIPCKTLDLKKVIRPIETEFNSQSKLFLTPDGEKGLSLDEILKKQNSKTSPLLTYNPGKKYGIKYFHLNDNESGYLFKTLIQYPSQFVESNNRTVVGITMHMLSDFFGSGVPLTTDRWYTSIALAINLFVKKITLLGTVKVNVLNRFFNTLLGPGGLKKCAKNTGKFVRNQVVFSSQIPGHISYYIYVAIYNDRKNKDGTFFLTSDKSMFSEGKEHKNGYTIITNKLYTNDLTSNERPSIVDHYNMTMGATDLFDSMTHRYTICTRYRNNRWILRVVETFRDFEFQNCYILHKKHTTTAYTRTKFYYALAHGLLSPPVPEADLPLTRTPRKRKLPPIRQDSLKKCKQIQVRCYLCPTRRKASLTCQKCTKIICKDKHSILVCNNCNQP